MKTPVLLVSVLIAGYAFVGACSESSVSHFQYAPSLASVPDERAGSLHYRVLHNFGEGSDGSRPTYLIAVGDAFYGTTQSGGSRHCITYGGCGTLYRITTNGTEKVLHNFGVSGDGSDPSGALIDVNGMLYGTTVSGGTYGHGTVFSMTLTGDERVLHSFGAKPDGGGPSAGLIDVRGVLYGTTFGGGIGCGTEGCGTVFSVTTAGKEKILYRFDDAMTNEGWYPDAGLIEIGGALYGTTFEGGYGPTPSWGTFFRVTGSGKEQLLYKFGRGNGGWYPAGDLLPVRGALYGTTAGGGAHNCQFNDGGCGTIFSITTNGKERLLHSFTGMDGSQPQSGLTNIDGTLYGTTSSGGANSCGPYHRCGTVFSLTTNGSETVLHSFRAETGYLPTANLIYERGAFYGTAQLGGLYGSGPPYNGGVFFSLTP